MAVTAMAMFDSGDAAVSRGHPCDRRDRFHTTSGLDLAANHKVRSERAHSVTEENAALKAACSRGVASSGL